MLEEIVRKYFSFVVDEYHFKQLPEYNFVREIHMQFIRDNIVINIVFEGSYVVEVIDTHKPIEALINGTKKITDFDYFKFRRYYISHLNIKSHKNYSANLSIDYERDNPEIGLIRRSAFLKSYPKILEGELKGIRRLARRHIKNTIANIDGMFNKLVKVFVSSCTLDSFVIVLAPGHAHLPAI